MYFIAWYELTLNLICSFHPNIIFIFFTRYFLVSKIKETKVIKYGQPVSLTCDLKNSDQNISFLNVIDNKTRIETLKMPFLECTQNGTGNYTCKQSADVDVTEFEHQVNGTTLTIEWEAGAVFRSLGGINCGNNKSWIFKYWSENILILFK